MALLLGEQLSSLQMLFVVIIDAADAEAEGSWISSHHHHLRLTTTTTKPDNKAIGYY